MLELLFLILPLAAGYGYLMGRNSAQKTHREVSNKFSGHYYKGLNFLLADEKDKAVDTLIKLMDETHDSLDTQIAMGKLFRHKGELDRAIRLHQEIVVKEGLSLSEKSQALNELAIDYVQAGFLERAEESFLHLLNEYDYNDNAVYQLLSIYQTTREWQRGIDLYTNFASQHQACSEKNHQVIGHFYCELVKDTIDSTTLSKQAVETLKSVITSTPYPIRAMLQLAQLFYAQEQYQLTYEYATKIIKHDPIWCSEVATILYDSANRTQQLPVLLSLLDDYSAHSTAAYLIQAQIIDNLHGSQQARDLILHKLRDRPSTKGLEALLESSVNSVIDDCSNQSIVELHQLLIEQMKARPSYRCDNCGFSSKILYWQCPSCRQWDSVKPITGIDGD